MGNQNWNTSIQGVSEQLLAFVKWTISSGEFFTEADVRSSARVIVLGQTIVDNLFYGTDPVGQYVRVMELPFRVVGVLGRKGQDAQGRDQDDIAFAPYTTVQKKLLGTTRIQIAYVSAISADATYTAQLQISDLSGGGFPVINRMISLYATCGRGWGCQWGEQHHDLVAG